MQIDNTPPSGTITVPSDLHGPQIISGTASDSGSGVGSWQVQVAREGSTEWLSACPAQLAPTTGSTYQCTVEGFSFTNGVYELRALITDNAGNTYTTTSASTRSDNAAPAGTSPPVIIGRAWTAQTLKASTGTWSGTEPFTYVYQWQSCNSSGEACANIAGATGSSYVVKNGDLGNTLRVLVGASNPVGAASSTSAASAVVVESSCTDTWQGPNGGAWQTAGNWSAGVVPGPSDIACVPAGTTVDVTAGTNQTGSLRDQGGLAISGGSLEVANGLEIANVSSLALSGGELILAGELEVDSSFTGTGSGHPTITGTGTLLLKPTTTNTIDNQECSSGGGDFFLSGIDLINQGTLTFGTTGTADGDIVMSNGAQLQNNGTLNANTWSNNSGPCNNTNYSFVNNGGSTPSITNTGTLNANPGTSHTILTNVPFNNQGTVLITTGTLQLTGGGSDSKGTLVPDAGATVSFTSGSYALSEDTLSGSGTIGVAGAAVSATNLQGSGGHLSVSGGSFTIPAATTSPISSVTLTSGTLSVSGELDVGEAFTGNGSGHPTISGSGHLVLTPTATGVIDGQACSSGGGDFFLSGIDVLNEGLLTFGPSSGGADGDLVMSAGAQIQNSGTLNANSWSNDIGPCNNTNYSFFNDGGSAPSVTNTGTFSVGPGTSQTVLGNVAFNNHGTVKIATGTLQLTGGGSGSSSRLVPSIGHRALLCRRRVRAERRHILWLRHDRRGWRRGERHQPAGQRCLARAEWWLFHHPGRQHQFHLERHAHQRNPERLRRTRCERILHRQWQRPSDDQWIGASGAAIGLHGSDRQSGVQQRWW